MLRRQLPKISAISLILLSIFSFPASAATFTVTTRSDSGTGSLRQMLTTANANPDADTIVFGPAVTGTIALTSGELPVSGAVTIDGPGARVLTISGTSSSRIFNIADGATVGIEGLTIIDGVTSQDGGAIWNGKGALTITNCALSNSLAIGNGGALKNLGGTVRITNSTLSNNTAQHAGALFNEYGIMTVVYSTLSDNTARGNGGAIHNTRNTSGAVLKGTLILANSTLSGNTAWSDGGGIHNYNGIVNITNSTLSGNTARMYGGGLTSDGELSTITILSSTVSGNTGKYGGGLYPYTSSKLTLGNTLVSGNKSLTTGYPNEIVNNTAVVVSRGYNLFGVDGAAGINGFTPLTTDITPLPGVILSKIIGLLADNGGPTKTRRLVDGSPAIDKGGNALIPKGVTTDQRGPGFLRILGTTVDIGAAEGSGGGGTTFALSVDKTGGLGTVTSIPAGTACGSTCDAHFAEGAQVALTVTEATGYGFTGWTGDCTGTTCALTMDAAKSVTALFTNVIPDKLLTVTKAGNGTGTVTGDGINCGTDCTQNYFSNASVTLTAAPAFGSSFAGWTGSCTVNQDTPWLCTVTMHAAKTVKATFAKPALLTVRKVGRGIGTVVSLPTDILCGTQCTQLYPYNTEVYLMAISATGSTFSGWTNNCPVVAVYPGLKQVCKATMDQAKTVTATFTK